MGGPAPGPGRSGNAGWGRRLVSADPAGRYTRPLELLTLAFGPHVVIGEEFGSLEAIAVAIYGSWAARYEGIPGHPPHEDLDVLVIGEVARRSCMRRPSAPSSASIAGQPRPVLPIPLGSRPLTR